MRRKNSLFVFVLLAIGVLLSQVELPQHERSIPYVEVTKVFDGDTIEVRLENGVSERVRYIGIDTPESYVQGESPECFSMEAKEANEKLVLDKWVQLVPDVEDRDKFGRLLRYVYTEDTFVNMKMMEDGFATTLSIPPNTQYAEVFEVVEKDARSEGKGLWSACKSVVLKK